MPVLPEGPAWLVGIAIAGWVLVSVVKAVTGIRRNGHSSGEHDVAARLATIEERLNHMPTKDDLQDGLAKNRHDVRNAVAGKILREGAP